VGWEPWVPFQFIGDNGQLTGLDIDLTRTIFDDMGCTLSFVEMPWQRQKTAMRANKIDIMMSLVKNKITRSFSTLGNAFRDINYVLLVKKSVLEQQPKLSLLEDLSGTTLRIGIVQLNSYQADYEKRLYSSKLSSNIIVLRDDIAVLTGLAKGRLDGMLVNQEFAQYHLKKIDTFEQYIALPHLAPPHDLTYVGFSRKISTPQLIEKFNRSLDNILANGKHQEIVTKYSNIDWLLDN